MRASRGMGAIAPSKMPGAKRKARRDNTDFMEDGVMRPRRDDTDFTQYAEGGKVGLYANINAKRKRGEKMRKPGSKGAPTEQAFIDSAKTARK
jgi:hypothetical protein